MRMTNDPRARYQGALAGLPKPGYGLGFHSGSLGVATLGARAGLSPERVFEDLCQAAQGGARIEPDNQIANTVRRAFAEHANGFIPKPRPKPLVHDGQAVLRKIIEKGKGATEKSILEASPIPIPDRPEHHAMLVLQTLYPPDALLFIGQRDEPGSIGQNIRKAGEWCEHFRRGGRTAPFIIVNPLDGRPHEKKNGDSMTYRGDGCVSDFRYAVAEFDNIPLEGQLCFWSGVALPIVALIDSGNRSVHGWVDAQKLAPIRSMAEWDVNIRDDLYLRFLVPMGIDGACSNASRLSRLPGYLRDTGRWQRLLFLSPDGRRIHD
jgi:hypothetical protein